jgi:hypothetical protein
MKYQSTQPTSPVSYQSSSMFTCPIYHGIVDYTMDEIREAIGVQHCGEEVLVVQYLIGQSNVPKTSQSHVHSPPTVDPPVLKGK